MTSYEKLYSDETQGVLVEFLECWYDWAYHDGCVLSPKNSIFSKSDGLCGNLRKFCVYRGYDSSPSFLLDLFLFQHFGEGRAYPFGGYSLFWEEVRMATAHLNPKRIDYVLLLLKELTGR